jgi:hypothetical protein
MITSVSKFWLPRCQRVGASTSRRVQSQRSVDYSLVELLLTTHPHAGCVGTTGTSELHRECIVKGNER